MTLFRAILCVCLSVAAGPCLAEEIKTLADVHQRLQGAPLTAADGAALEAFVRKSSKGGLKAPDHAQLIQRHSDGGGYGGWATRSSSAKEIRIVAGKGKSWTLTKVPETDLFIAVDKFGPQSAVNYRVEIDGVRQRGSGESRFGFDSYPWKPDSLRQEGVPQGELIAMGKHVSEKYYPGAERQWWIYVPAQYADSQEPAKLMVFNDGGGFTKGDGNACIVFDNLIHQKKIPVTIAVFVNPGVIPARDGRPEVANRGNEYDTCTPRFATFLDEEILPIVREKYRISPVAEDHIICGSSSGGSCAFTAAWHRNDLFAKAVTFIGSFCDFRQAKDFPEYGTATTLPADEFSVWKTAHDYPGLIRKTDPRRNLKIYLQDGDNDLNNAHGNWFLENQRMAAALEYAGYDYHFETGHGMHSKAHGMHLLPEILVWMWSENSTPNGKN